MIDWQQNSIEINKRKDLCKFIRYVENNVYTFVFIGRVKHQT